MFFAFAAKKPFIHRIFAANNSYINLNTRFPIKIPPYFPGG
jgi:hypothetical protein